MKTPTLISDRITLRKQTLAEVLYSRKWGGNPRITQFLYASWGKATDEEQKKFWRKANRGNQMLFAIVLNETAEFIGGCDVKFEPKHERAEVGIMIGEEKYHGQGIGTEVIKMLRDYLFQVWKIHRFQLYVLTNNPRAKKCYEKCGFQTEGLLRDYHKKGKQFRSLYIMSILKKDWQKLEKIKFKMFE